MHIYINIYVLTCASCLHTYILHTFLVYVHTYICMHIHTTDERLHICICALQGSQSTWKNDDSFSSHGKIMEFYNFTKYHWKNGGKPWKKGLSVIFAHVIFFCCIGLCPFKCTFGRNFGTFELLVVISDGRVHGASWAGMLLDYKKGDRASANSYPQVASSEACPHCISQPAHPAWGKA